MAVLLENGLTEKQDKFAYLYVKYGEGKKAAEEAGYSKKGAGQQANVLLKNPKVMAVIGKYREKPRQDRIASAEEVLETLTRVLRGEISQEVVTVLQKGNGISEAELVDKEVDPRDRIKAGELLGKRYRLWDQVYEPPKENKLVVEVRRSKHIDSE